MLREAPILAREFFNRDPVTVGRELLGKLLIRREGRKLLAGRIVEDEAYLGRQDPAAHAFAGMTARNFVLFGPPGHAYVYFIYGNHYCLNVWDGCHGSRAWYPPTAVASSYAITPYLQRSRTHVGSARHHSSAR